MSSVGLGVPLLQVSPIGQGDDRAMFLAEFRALRDRAALDYEELAARAHYPTDVLRDAEDGPGLPGLPILTAYVRACGGDSAEWEERWRRLASSADNDAGLPVRPAGASPAAVAGARAGVTVAPAEAHDAERIKAALRAHREREEQATRNGQPWPSEAEPDPASTAAAASTWPGPSAAASTWPGPSAAASDWPGPSAAASDWPKPKPKPKPPAAASAGATAQANGTRPAASLGQAPAGEAADSSAKRPAGAPVPGPREHRAPRPASRPGLLTLIVVLVLLGCVAALAFT